MCGIAHRQAGETRTGEPAAERVLRIVVHEPSIPPFRRIGASVSYGTHLTCRLTEASLQGNRCVLDSLLMQRKSEALMRTVDRRGLPYRVMRLAAGAIVAAALAGCATPP